MPRKRESVRTRPIQPAHKSKNNEIQQLLDEDSDSSFQSASTNRETTLLDLEYTNRSSRDQNQTKNASTSKQNPARRTSARKSNNSRSGIGSQESEGRDITRASISPNRQSQGTGEDLVSRGQNPHDMPQSQPTGSSKRKTSRPVRQDQGTSKRPRLNQVWKQIQICQHRTSLLVPKLSFSRVIREIAMAEATFVTKFTSTALMAIQEAAETYLVQLFQDCYMCTMHRGRVTLMVKDMELVRYLRGRLDPGNL